MGTTDKVDMALNLLRGVAHKWRAQPYGESFENGMCASEIAAGDLDRITKESFTRLDQLFDRLHQVWDLGDVDFGNWKQREFARGRERWHGYEVAQVKHALGEDFAVDFVLAGQRARDNMAAFERQVKDQVRSSGQALAFDVRGFLKDPNVSISADTRKELTQQLDQAGMTPDFFSFSRTMRKSLAEMMKKGEAQTADGLRSVLENFGNPRGLFYGLVPDGQSLETSRRYRAK